MDLNVCSNSCDSLDEKCSDITPRIRDPWLFEEEERHVCVGDVEWIREWSLSQM